MNHNDYADAGMHIFGLMAAVDFDGAELPEKQKYKKPRCSNWQHTPQWSDEQLDFMEEQGYFATGFGVLVKGMLIIDVDARNGGVASFNALAELIPAVLDAGLIVETGSGGGSKHYYFTLEESTAALVQAHAKFPGIDFKTSGYVVGAGSLHASGAYYEAESGHPTELTAAPPALVELLRKPDNYRVSHGGTQLDVSEQQLVDMLNFIDPDMSYPEWFRVGAAIHHVTGGSGFDIWDEWSAKGSKYVGPGELKKSWDGLGRSTNPTTFGTLHAFATSGGWESPVEFESDIDFGDVSAPVVVDLRRPPGFVGVLTDWINGQSLYPRENIAVAVALTAVSALCGMRIEDEKDGISPNLFAFCVAGSSTGKEAMLKSFSAILREAGMAPAIYGSIKSEQEIYRNLLRHQLAAYLLDEIGEQLSKLTSSKSDYLTGVIGLLMSAYSKGDSFLPVTGDLKEAVKADIVKELKAVEKALEKGQSSKLAKREECLMRQLESIDMGIERPYLSMLGFTTPVLFDNLFTLEQSTNGFLSRAMIFREKETNPRRKEKFVKKKMTDSLRAALWSLRSPGAFDMDMPERIEHSGPRTVVHTTDDAAAELDAVYEYFWEMAEEQKATSLEAVPRRGYEMTAKVSLLLAAPEGIRTAEHVQWAAELVKQDTNNKLIMARGNTAESELDRQAAKVVSHLSKDDPITLGVLKARVHKLDEALVNKLVDAGYIIAQDSGKKRGGKPVMHYYLK